ncbi:MAG: right-handed parallel beta-helix repeat-containing protein [Planctomycetes bacterium]|nr:right-handed parallel beta-helix repeat-containing protein [Planctomycetota bacterium]
MSRGAFLFRLSQFCFALAIATSVAVGGEPTRMAGRAMLFVDQNATGPTHDGRTWCTAFTDLQDALDLAFFDVTIRVANGTYKPDRGTGNRTASFTIINNTQVEGGYAGCGAIDPNARDFDQFESILSGDLNSDDTGDLTHPSRDENSQLVVLISGSTAILDGFTVTAGNSDNGSGGGILMLISPTVANLRVTRNSASLDGGGLRIDGVSDGNLLSCIFQDNTARDGGAVFIQSSNVTFHKCRFLDNSGAVGGAVRISSNSNAAFTDSAFSYNTAGSGGAVYISAGEGSFTFARCVFLGNVAFPGRGGGIYKSGNAALIVRSCVFNANSAGLRGGGIYGDSSRLDILNSTFFANFALESGRAVAGSADLNSCILWDGGNEALGATITNSNVQGGWPGGNIFALPMFVDADGEDDIPGNEDDDFRLLAASPCTDAGDPNFVADPGATDLDGFDRVIDGNNDNKAVVDMGAYEFPGDCIGSDFDGDGVADVCDADRDDDGVPNNLDVCEFTLPGAAVDAEGRPLGDLNRDCGTDLIDYTIMQNGWSGPAGSPD